MSDLLKKLKALGLKIEKASDIEVTREKSISIDEIIDGRWLEIQGEKVFILEKRIPFGQAHGNITLAPPQEFGFMSSFMGIDEDIQLDKLLFIDTETSSLSSGTGSFVFLIGISYFIEDGLEIIQIFLDQPHQELAFLNYFDELLEKFTTFVSYNGKAFDIPMLRSRFIMNKLPHSLDTFHHFDLLHTSRRIWKLRLESRRLADIETEILSFDRSDEEIPGWLVPQIYFDYLDSNDASPLKGVFYHNEIDVVSLAAIFIYINNMLSENGVSSAIDGRDIYSIGYTLGKMGLWKLSEEFYQSGIDKGLPDEFRNEAIRNFAYAYKRQEKWSEALKCWRIAAENGDYLSCIELAKYYEHRTKDLDTAIIWTNKAFICIEEPNRQELIIKEILHRKSRLDRKKEKEVRENEV